MTRRRPVGASEGLGLILGSTLIAIISAATLSADQPKGKSPGAWGFQDVFGTGAAGGDFGNLFTKPVSGELDFFHQSGGWRFGIGESFGSFKMKDPYHDELEWGFQQTYLFGQRMLRTEGAFRPYVQLRAGLARLRPRSELFKMNPLPPDFVKGQATQSPADGFSTGLLAGFELKLSRAAFLDASVAGTYFHTSEYDLSAVGQPPRSSGTALEGRLGLTWYPNGGEHGDGGPRDAWGVRQSYGWAAGEVLAINYVAGIASQYVRNVDWSEVSPRSWWYNVKSGFAYDPDTFKTNQWSHPFNGSQYYNSSRSNGLGFWPSSAFAVFGAFRWECCGETQSMSFNDMFSTGLGGIALGETQYRLSSEILNNDSRGMGRFWRELGGFFVDPMRGVNRLVSGDGTSVSANPEDPMDWRPAGAGTFVGAGVRSIGEGSSITNNTKTYATLMLNHTYGDVFENTRRKPFDYIDFVGELNFGADVALGDVQIRGDIASWALGDDKKHPDHVLEVVQHFDYMNNTAYTFGGQSLGAALSSRFRLSNKVALRTRVDGYGIIMGAVNADYSWLADVEPRERIREYDYGPGLGATGRANLVWNGWPVLTALWRFAWINVTNGSEYNKGSLGSDASHYVQGGGVRLVVPVKWGLGVGADAYLFLRDSHYVFRGSGTGKEVRNDVSQRNPQVRIYIAMSNGR